MFFVDSQLTITRRDSSLIKSYTDLSGEFSRNDTTVSLSSNTLVTSVVSSVSLRRHKVPVQDELITAFLETMLDSIVKSWEVIEIKQVEQNDQITKNQPAEPTVLKKDKGKKASARKLTNDPPSAPATAVWWNGPDERVRIVFHNGNVYEGNVSMKCLHREGKFTWSSGTSYMGNFHYNVMHGRGIIEWRNLSWYEGDFSCNVRHGRGLFVDPLSTIWYIGDWANAAKHGSGAMHYSYTSSYDGEWSQNVRHGYGVREYSPNSGYKGNWENFIRDGKGVMIWPNHDVSGDWKDGTMNGHGVYVWNMQSNDTLSTPSQTSYKGYWKNGMRHGNGLYRYGYANGSHYKGQFCENKKHGKGSLVTGDGTILQSKKLFIDDNLTPMDSENNTSFNVTTHENGNFDMCSEMFDVSYHVGQSLKKKDSRPLILKNILDNYISVRKRHELRASKETCTQKKQSPSKVKSEEPALQEADLNLQLPFSNQCNNLQKAVKCLEMELKTIYHEYAQLCNTEDIEFSPILIRLYMWQMYYDCRVHEKGLTLTQIDDIIYYNPAWLIQNRHNPFEKIYYWQFLHGLIAMAVKLYYSETTPCDVAFRKFILEDIIPNFRANDGAAHKVCTECISLTAAYKLYHDLGEPHTIRRFIQATRYPTHLLDAKPPSFLQAKDTDVICGRNTFMLDDFPSYVTEKFLLQKPQFYVPVDHDLKLFILDVLPNKVILEHFAAMFPRLQESGCIVDLNIQLTFVEFYQILLACAKDSMAVREALAKRSIISSL